MNRPALITDHLEIWTAARTSGNGSGRGSGANAQVLYGLKRLRELILDLAVRGKLVAQDPGDEPASVLLKKIAREKARLIREGKIKKGKPLPEIGEDEKPFEAPEGWEWVRLGNIAQHNSGKTLDKRRNTGQFRDYITTSNLYWGRFELDTVRQMRIRNDELEKCTARKDDLLICEGGEAGRAAVWYLESEMCFQNHIHRARFYGGIFPYFVFRFFEKLNATGEINQYRQGVGISSMSGKTLASIAFPLPPIAEQHRIVAKVDELMALCDRLEQQQTESIATHQTLVETLLSTLTRATDATEFAHAWERIHDTFEILFTTEYSIEQLKKTILQLAVMGKLVPQDPNDEPASVLLGKIAKEKQRLIREGKIKKAKPLPEIGEDEKPFELPEGWEWTKIANSTISCEYGLSEKTYDTVGGVPVLKMGDIQDGKVHLGGQKMIPHTVEGLPHLFLKKWDLLYNRTNSADLVGKTGLFEGPDDTFTFASYLIRIRCSPNAVHPKYLNHSMNSPYFRLTQIEPQLKQQCGQANVNGTLMKNMIIPIPPLNEQHRIIAKVDALMALCDKFKAQISEVQTTQVQLADSIVERAVG